MRPGITVKVRHSITARMKDTLSRTVQAARQKSPLRFAGGFRPGLKRKPNEIAAPLSAVALDDMLEETETVDPIVLSALALEVLGPATMRAAVEGRTVTVTVEDAELAEQLRAVLRETAKRRPTDRMIQILDDTRPSGPAH